MPLSVEAHPVAFATPFPSSNPPSQKAKAINAQCLVVRIACDESWMLWCSRSRPLGIDGETLGTQGPPHCSLLQQSFPASFFGHTNLDTILKPKAEMFHR